MSDLIVRCSSIGKLMAKPEKADLFSDLVTPEVAKILAKTKGRTDDEISVLEDVRRKSLSAGGKTHVRELVREAIYGFEPPQLFTRPILKGQQVEGECIALLSRLLGRPLKKNSERRTNGLITGECDIFEAELRHGRDIKAPFTMETMPLVLADAYDSGYEWQMQGYEILWDADTWSVDYVLVNTPDDLIGHDDASVHYVDHLDEHLRWTSWLVKRDRALESLIVDKVLAARRYYREVMNEFDRTHRGKEPPPWVTEDAPVAAPAPAPAPMTAARLPSAAKAAALPASLFG